MWFQLFIATLSAIVFLVAPGVSLALALGSSVEFSLGIAPLLALACYGLLSVCYGAVGIPCNWMTLFLFVLVIGVVLCLVHRYRPTRSRKGAAVDSDCRKLDYSEDLRRPFQAFGILRHISPIQLALVLAILAGLATSLAVYVGNIGDPNAFIQNYDNASHLSRIHLFAQQQNYSTFLGGFYPSAWHGVAAMVESALGISSMMAEHATNLAFIIVVFPTSSVMLLSTLFPHRRRAVWMGGMLCLSFGFFPWRIMLFGPLYPNLSAFAIMPAVAALFILLCESDISFSVRCRYAVLFIAGGIAMALAQPNAIFSAGAFLIPFCVWRAYRLVYDMRAGKAHRIAIALLAAAALVVAFIACWVLLSQAPFMSSVVNYPRETRLGLAQAIRWALGFSFVLKRQQYLIGAVVVVGGIVLLTRPKVRWVTISYALLVALFVVAISVEGPIKHILVGFWYSDFYRLAATVCVFAVPLVATGMDALACAVERCFDMLLPMHGNKTQKDSARSRVDRAFRVLIAAVIVVAIMAINYIPFDFIPQYYRSYGLDAVSFEMHDMYQNPANRVLDDKELAFVDRVKEIVSTDEEVFNNPFDGSVFTYAACNLDVTYNSLGVEPSPQTALLRERLCDIASDSSVRKAAQEEGVRYVLQLDQGFGKNGFSDEGTVYLLGYDPKLWQGVNSIHDDTPGFECVLSDGDMRLYRVED